MWKTGINNQSRPLFDNWKFGNSSAISSIEAAAVGDRVWVKSSSDVAAAKVFESFLFFGDFGWCKRALKFDFQ